ncbi:hypothetical protein WN66_05262 [Saccharomyces cerevisiae]|uniref:Putative uncharacterized protein YNL276C n=2 Tax=Saccharomyces cerevisiae TaxID=4932 RepID=YN16_YEAST|nr:RecName: Full=Putative uncharacterized protein YNL276C [Saccharomyces cerevisiae S288C]KZV08349.1 hypothetical protein WN66_05262 [Saccharomyces cerevisiae]CAA96189.1 unnamed protein product [Saccharomyces cerevisiae]CAY82336.1 EC1118_1N9_0628p [Saccharomyces cerevisiae EC1118]
MCGIYPYQLVTSSASPKTDVFVSSLPTSPPQALGAASVMALQLVFKNCTISLFISLNSNRKASWPSGDSIFSNCDFGMCSAKNSCSEYVNSPSDWIPMIRDGCWMVERTSVMSSTLSLAKSCVSSLRVMAM